MYHIYLDTGVNMNSLEILCIIADLRMLFMRIAQFQWLRVFLDLC